MLSQNDLHSVTYMVHHTAEEDYPYIKTHAQMEIDMIRNQCRDRMMSDKEQCAFEFAVSTITHINIKELNIACRYSATRH